MAEGSLRELLDGRDALLIVATRREADAVIAGLERAGQVRRAPAPCHAPAGSGATEWKVAAFLESPLRAWVVISGVGKSNAAGAAATWLASFTAARHDGGKVGAVLNLGIAGALPGAAPLAIGSLALASRSVFGDEGLDGPAGFVDVASMGFPPFPAPDERGRDGDPALLAALAPHADALARIATVSTCAGTDQRARQIAERTGAAAEAMEGASVALAAARFDTPFVEVRSISNTTGDRAAQIWDLGGALARLERLVADVTCR